MNNTTNRGMTFTAHLGRQIRGEATKRNLTAKALAGLIGIHPVTMSKYLNAKIDPPASFISDCADALAIDADALVGPAYAAMLAQLGPLSEGSYRLAAHTRDIQAEHEGFEEAP